MNSSDSLTERLESLFDMQKGGARLGHNNTTTSTASL